MNQKITHQHSKMDGAGSMKRNHIGIWSCIVSRIFNGRKVFDREI